MGFKQKNETASKPKFKTTDVIAEPIEANSEEVSDETNSDDFSVN